MSYAVVRFQGVDKIHDLPDNETRPKARRGMIGFILKPYHEIIFHTLNTFQTPD